MSTETELLDEEKELDGAELELDEDIPVPVKPPESKKKVKKEKQPKPEKAKAVKVAPKLPPPKPVPAVREVPPPPEHGYYNMDEEDRAQLVKCLAMAGEGSRLSLLQLCNGERRVADIAQLIHISQPALSHHIALLKHSNLIKQIRVGKENFYKLTKDGLVTIKAAKIISDYITSRSQSE